MEPVLFFNGWGATLASVQPWLTSLQPRLAFAEDLRGAGKRVGEPPGFSIQDLAADGLGWLKERGFQGAHIMGVSMGGLIAQAFALSYPERTRSLSLVSTYPGTRVRLPMEEQDRQVWQGDTEDPLEDAKRRLRLVLSESYQRKRPEAVERLSNTMLLGLSPQQVAGRKAQQQAMEGFDPYQDLDRLRVPTLVVTGDEDRIVPQGNSDLLQGKIAGARLELMPGAGHLLLVEKPRELANLLDAFWREAE